VSRIYDALRRVESADRVRRLDPGSARLPFRVLTVTNNKGGVGKSTLATNLAVYFRALREDLPVLFLALDDQPLPDRMFGLDASPPGETMATALRRGRLDPAIRLGQYGVHYVPSSPEINELKKEIADPFHLKRVFRGLDWRGIVVVDTKSDTEILTQNAIAASDLALVVVSDHASLLQAEGIYALLREWNLPPEHARVVLSMVDLRIKYTQGETRDILALLLSEIRRRGYPLFESFISRSQKVESLYTNPEGRAYSILHGAEGSLVQRQMHHLADDVLRVLQPAPRPAPEIRLPESAPSTPAEAQAPAAPLAEPERPASSPEPPPAAEPPVAFLRGLTPQASGALAQSVVEIRKFPFRIGRNNPFSENDLTIPDHTPRQVSRRHLELVERDGRIGVTDRGSQLGTLVDGMPLGGAHGFAGPIFPSAASSVIVLGEPSSVFAFELRIGSQPHAHAP
jgi:cellulose biosynthesis protein BcsQ/pSer/pThr/pTyr-binding forkhead associated (FHA) protein